MPDPLELYDFSVEDPLAAYAPPPSRLVESVAPAVRNIPTPGKGSMEVADRAPGGLARMVEAIASNPIAMGVLLGGVAPGRRRPASRSAAPAPAVSRLQPPEQGRYFDLRRLDDVPNVPQHPLERYNPPRGVPERTQDLVANRTVRRRLGETMDEGAMAGGQRWYNADPLRDAFVTQLGPARGESAFRQYMEMVAATSPRSRVPESIRNASYYYSLLRRGDDLPVPGTPNPQPYGHIAQRNHQLNARAFAEGRMDPFQNPKPISFAENLRGNQTPGTIDAHAVNLPAMIARDPRWLATGTRVPLPTGGWQQLAPQRMFRSGELTMRDALQRPTFWSGHPRETEYAALEAMYSDLARARGLTTAGGQASAWLAGGRTTGLQSASEPFMRTFEDVLIRTAEARGQPVSRVLSDFIAGRAPLLSIPAAAAVGAGLTAGDTVGSE